MTEEKRDKTKDKLSSYYRCYFCEKCGYVELPESITGKPVFPLHACPDCGEEKKFSMRVGRFVYEDSREWSFKKMWFKNTYTLSKFIPGLDRKDQNPKKAKTGKKK